MPSKVSQLTEEVEVIFIYLKDPKKIWYSRQSLVTNFFSFPCKWD